MRAAILTVILSGVILASPPVDIATPGGGDMISVATIAAMPPDPSLWNGPPSSLGPAGAASLVFAVPPKPEA